MLASRVRATGELVPARWLDAALVAGLLVAVAADTAGGPPGRDPPVAVLPFLSMLQLAGYRGDSLGVGATGPLSAAVFPLYLAATLAAAAAALARRDATRY